jgi:D-glycero-alpha-D-manno-heptose-7-phosphate kinase
MRSALQRGDIKELGLLLHQGWQAKRRISSKISTSRIDELYSLARQNGALGGKITGAGGGGFLLLYCEPEFQGDVREAMRRENIYEMNFGFDMQGAQAIVNDPFVNRDEHSGCRWTFVPAQAPVI